MRLAHIHELKPAAEQAVIINAGTKQVSTLALLSALRYANMPVLLIDCESQDGSIAYFSELMRSYTFDLLSAPLNNHGLTLDWLFANIPAQQVLLIDSDLEIRGSGIIDLMRQFITPERTFGSGFVHDATWMGMHNMFFGYYVERMWIPLTLLKVALVRRALEHGQSFFPQTVFNDFPPSRFVSRMLVKRFRIPLLRHWKIRSLDLFRKEFFGEKPSFLKYDTGALLYQYLKAQGYAFTGLPLARSDAYVTHFHGVTRVLLNKRDHTGAQLDVISAQVGRRLREQYGVAVAD